MFSDCIAPLPGKRIDGETAVLVAAGDVRHAFEAFAARTPDAVETLVSDMVFDAAERLGVKWCVDYLGKIAVWDFHHLGER